MSVQQTASRGEGVQRQRRKAARPSELTAAALALFVEKGFAATRLDEIAARAGVSKGTLYLYFDSKEALFEAAIRDGILPLVEAVEAQAERLAGDPERMLREILSHWWSGVVATDLGGIPKLMLAEAASFPAVARFFYENVVERGRRLIRAALERGVQSGQFRPLDMEIATSLFFVPALHAATWGQSPAFSDACAHEPRAFLENHLEIYLRGIRAEQKGCSR
jgi:AcrR family transcriptional regulator